ARLLLSLHSRVAVEQRAEAFLREGLAVRNAARQRPGLVRLVQRTCPSGVCRREIATLIEEGRQRIRVGAVLFDRRTDGRWIDERAVLLPTQAPLDHPVQDPSGLG